MKKLDKVLDAIMRFLMAVSMFGLLAFGFWQIFSRWVLQDPSTITDEVLRYLLIWASMIGSTYCFYKDQHLALDLVTSRAKGTFAIVLKVLAEIAILFFVGYVFIYGGFRLVDNAINKSSVLRIPFKVLYAIFPISGIFIYIARILNYVQAFVKMKEAKNAPEGGAEE